jgi:hypothetical protein
VTTTQAGETRLEQSAANALQFPIFLGVVLVAVFVRQFIGAPPNPVVLAVCGVAVLLVVVFGLYAVRNAGAMIVTPDRITFTRHRAEVGTDRGRQVIERAAGSTLTFRVARNGPMGSKYTGYILKLRDTATGAEVFAGAFGRRKVQQACESHGWRFT